MQNEHLRSDHAVGAPRNMSVAGGDGSLVGKHLGIELSAQVVGHERNLLPLAHVRHVGAQSSLNLAMTK